MESPNAPPAPSWPVIVLAGNDAIGDSAGYTCVHPVFETKRCSLDSDAKQARHPRLVGGPSGPTLAAIDGGTAMRVLVTWGSTSGGTEGIGRMLADTLHRDGVDVVARSASGAHDLRGVDAVIIGGALYANRWHADARRFVRRHAAELRRIPVWFFSSGPLDTSADRATIPPVRQVQALMARVGAVGHTTFGGRLTPDAKGRMARAMARTRAGDWRNPARIESWATSIATVLPFARPRPVVALPGSAPSRLLGYGIAGWAACAALMAGLLASTSQSVAFVLHAIAAPLIFAALSSRYFKPLGARGPLPTALAFGAIVAALDAIIVAGGIERSTAMLRSIPGFWVPLALIVLASWATGSITSMRPATERPRSPSGGAAVPDRA